MASGPWFIDFYATPKINNQLQKYVAGNLSWDPHLVYKRSCYAPAVPFPTDMPWLRLGTGSVEKVDTIAAETRPNVHEILACNDLGRDPRGADGELWKIPTFLAVWCAIVGVCRAISSVQHRGRANTC